MTSYAKSLLERLCSGRKLRDSQMDELYADGYLRRLDNGENRLTQKATNLLTGKDPDHDLDD